MSLFCVYQILLSIWYVDFPEIWLTDTVKLLYLLEDFSLQLAS